MPGEREAEQLFSRLICQVEILLEVEGMDLPVGRMSKWFGTLDPLFESLSCELVGQMRSLLKGPAFSDF